MSVAEQRKQNFLLPSIKVEHMIAGVSGGILSTLLLHPLDLVKIRFEVNDGSGKRHRSYNGLWDALRTIHREDGFKGLYKGVSPNMWGAGAAWGLYFFFYNTMKSYYQGGNANVSMPAGVNMLIGTLAGVTTLSLTNPIWVVKTRMCLQVPGQVNASGEAVVMYRGMFHGLTSLYREEGIRGCYRGFVPGLFGVSHGAIQFVCYEQLKQYYCHLVGIPLSSHLSAVHYLSLAALSKLFASTSTYPYQVVRARLMDQQSDFTSMTDVVRRTFASEGWRGFYKGLSPNLLRVTPATCITFLVYEKMSHALLSSDK
ncbi:solute carrier family 25 member 32-like [Sycon ciliatum]|uniref:solute carrier family 25 member 32-like n=1 Tax=Sycon ciliatum TaxID=27933 RepID=UPI0020A8B9CC|eukprot:scpid63450/ scgid25986/ Mitochondrial folate transporter/carrier; Solute carrier family 25 member 32